MKFWQWNERHMIGLKAGGRLKIIIAIVIFSVLILFHELGHFLLAKRNGIIVDEFSLGMGPRIVSTVKGGTRYSLKLLPFGGSCLMRGEDGEEEGVGTFNGAPVWGRISVVAAGPIFNFILAFLVAVIVIGMVGYDPAEVTALKENSPAAVAGLQEGDIITRFNGSKIDIGRDMYNYEYLKGIDDQETTIEVCRDDKTLKIVYTPYSVDRYMLGFNYATPSATEPAQVLNVKLNYPFAKAGIEAGDVITAINDMEIASTEDLDNYFKEHPLDQEEVKVSFDRKGKAKSVQVTPLSTTYVEMGFAYNMQRVKTSPLGVIKYSGIELKYWVKTTIQSLAMLVNGTVSVNELSGPVGVVDVIGDAYEESRSAGALVTWMSIFNMMILLSVNLGVMNLLPVPALDGGRLIFLLIEAIRGKAINRQAEGMIHFAGLMLLMVLLIYVTFHDIAKIF